jgi:SNF2 family DNA or RNA helicase
MIRLKRMFARVNLYRTGWVSILDTPEVARDLQWLLERFAFEVDDVTLARLHRGAEEHRVQEEAVEAILRGDRPRLQLVEPARPAREYQQVAADLAISTGRLLITDELGLGKSMTGVLVLRAPDALPALVVTLTHLQHQWVDELQKTLPMLKAHIARKAKPYDLSKIRGLDGEPDVLIMNYQKVAGWADHLAGLIRSVIFDEAQELRRDMTLKYVAAAQIADAARYRIGLTATPVYNYGGEMWNVMNVLAPDALGTKEEFTREWGAGSRHDHVMVRDPEALGTYLRSEGLMIGRTRKEVGRELPEVIRIVQHVDADEETLQKLSGDAVEMAQLILSSSADSKERWKASGELDWRLRQATGIAKAPYVAAFVRMLLDSEEQVVLFGWHRAVYDLWAEQLHDLNPVFYTGTESPNQKLRAEALFKGGHARVMIMSLRAGAGLDGLQEMSHVAVFGELDWSPQVHGQCVGRLHRDGQSDPVVAYFLLSDEGSDPVIAEVLNLKRMQSDPMLNKDWKMVAPAAAAPERVKMLAAEVLRRSGVVIPQESLDDEETA